MRMRQTCFGAAIGVLALGLSPVGAAEHDTDAYAAASSDRPVLFLPAPYKRFLDTSGDSQDVSDRNLNGPPNKTEAADTARSVPAPGLSRGANGDAAVWSVRTTGSRHRGDPYPPNLLFLPFDLSSGSFRLSSPVFSVLRGLADRDAYSGAWAFMGDE